MKHVMLVEDEPNITESLRFILERAGFEVSSESNGADALERIFSSPPDALILDVMLPGLDGFDVLRRIREHPELGKLPVLMLTAKGQREDRKTALDAGANRFITKPFSNAEVVAAVTELAGES